MKRGRPAEGCGKSSHAAPGNRFPGGSRSCGNVKPFRSKGSRTVSQVYSELTSSPVLKYKIFLARVSQAVSGLRHLGTEIRNHVRQINLLTPVSRLAHCYSRRILPGRRGTQIFHKKNVESSTERFPRPQAISTHVATEMVSIVYDNLSQIVWRRVDKIILA
jgi:hypothetical protein